MTVYKYILQNRNAVETLLLPPGFRILSVAAQEDNLCMWAAVDPGPATERASVLVIGTGVGCHVLTPAAIFLGTVVMPNGLVWHMFHLPT